MDYKSFGSVVDSNTIAGECGTSSGTEVSMCAQLHIKSLMIFLLSHTIVACNVITAQKLPKKNCQYGRACQCMDVVCCFLVSVV